MLSEIERELKKNPETIFDTYDTSIDSRLMGNGIKERLAQLTQVLSTINGYKTHAMLMKKQAENKLEEVVALAWKALEKSNMNTTQKRVAVLTTEVTLNGEKTSINSLKEKINLYEYVYERGKDKANEASKSLDSARSMLSWDKQEYNVGQKGD